MLEQKDIGDTLLDEFDSMSIHKLSSTQERFRPRTASEDFLDAVEKQETMEVNGKNFGLKLGPVKNYTGPVDHRRGPVENDSEEEQKISRDKLRPEFRDMYIPGSWEEHTFEVPHYRHDSGGARLQQEDPVSTVLSIMDAASDLVQYVESNPNSSKAELNAHADAVADKAEQLFGRAFMLHHLGCVTDDYVNVLKGTEGFLARDLTTPKTYD